MPDKPNAAEPVKKPRFRWYQFRLRTRLVDLKKAQECAF